MNKEWYKEIQEHALRPHELHGQMGEEGAWAWIFKHIAPVHKFCVEFGCSDPTSYHSGSTTRWLVDECKWNYLWMDGNAKYNTKGARERAVKQHWIDADNIADLFKMYDVPTNLDLLSIDIDYNDWWVFRSILLNGYRPSVVCFEFNLWVDPRSSVSVAYDPCAKKDKTVYYGASLPAFKKLGSEFGYSLVHVFRDAGACVDGKYVVIPGNNGILIRSDLLPCVVDVDPIIFHSKSYLEPYKKLDHMMRKWVEV